MCTQLCPILCDPMDCSPPGSSVHGTFQARILEWVAMPSSRASSRPRDRTHVSVSCACCTGRQILQHCATWALCGFKSQLCYSYLEDLGKVFPQHPHLHLSNGGQNNISNRELLCWAKELMPRQESQHCYWTKWVTQYRLAIIFTEMKLNIGNITFQ